MKKFEHFKKYNPENADDTILYLVSDEGIDWYEAQKTFAENTYKIVVNQTHEIESFAQDASMLFPVDCSVYEVESLPDGFNLGMNYQYINGVIEQNKALFEARWQEGQLIVVNAALAQYHADIAANAELPEEFKGLATSQYTQEQYYSLLTDKKALLDYISAPNFPENSRPELSGIVQ